jgi:hypothetical protein
MCAAPIHASLYIKCYIIIMALYTLLTHMKYQRQQALVTSATDSCDIHRRHWAMCQCMNQSDTLI